MGTAAEPQPTLRTELVAGRGREVGPVMYALALVSVGLLLLERFA